MTDKREHSPQPHPTTLEQLFEKYNRKLSDAKVTSSVIGLLTEINIRAKGLNNLDSLKEEVDALVGMLDKRSREVKTPGQIGDYTDATEVARAYQRGIEIGSNHLQDGPTEAFVPRKNIQPTTLNEFEDEFIPFTLKYTLVQKVAEILIIFENRGLSLDAVEKLAQELRDLLDKESHILAYKSDANGTYTYSEYHDASVTVDIFLDGLKKGTTLSPRPSNQPPRPQI